MLSINIPVYNVIVDDLVLQLHTQAENLNILFEIRVYDDGSSEAIKKHNQQLRDIKNVVYIELEKNIGRAAIRNKMGFDSEFEKLLFIDADSKIIGENYLENYVKRTENNSVLCGGTAYSALKPGREEELLRWKYGTYREAIPAAQRNSQKGFIITANNFIISKNIFENIHFREELRGYGHEDTLLGFDLFKSGIDIVHIDNPVEHTGLEDAATFLEKSKSALDNLFFISKNLFDENPEFNRQIRFLNRYQKITRFVFPGFLRLFFKLFASSIERNLEGKHPSLFWFDVYKLSYYAGFST